MHGAGEPLVLVHGGLQTIALMAELVADAGATRQVIASSWRATGTPRLRGRPPRYEQMADDVAALVAELGLAEVDLPGYSLGGGVACKWPADIRNWCAGWW